MGANDNLSDVLIAEWPRSSRERWRVELQTYQGRRVVSIRAWYQDRQGQLRPGRDGMTTGVVQLAPLLDALVEAYRIACQAGMIEPEGEHDAAS